MMRLYAALPESVPVIGCSPPSWAARIALLEEGVEHEVIWLRFDRGEHRSPAMLALHPGGTVPLLVDGDRVLTDTLDILRHVVDHSEAKRLAVDDPDRLDDGRRIKEAGMAVLRALMRDEADTSVWAPLREALDRWERRFESQPEQAQRLDIASVLLFVYAATAQSLGLRLQPWPGVEDFVAAAAARPSVLSSGPEPDSQPD